MFQGTLKKITTGTFGGFVMPEGLILKEKLCNIRL